MVGASASLLPSLQAIKAKFSTPRATSTAAHLLERSSVCNGESFILNGWLHRKPKKLNKSLTFAKLRDSKGTLIQIVDKNTPSLFKHLKPDSAISVQVEKSGDDYECKALHILGAANLVPGELQAEETKEWPAKYRFIQLRQPKFQNILKTRAKIIQTCRSVLEKHGFTEVETPILFKSTPEGAREFLVPTRRKGLAYALPQSPQQYKQLLIASGIDKYYQVAKCFRDEDLRADRQPEFTQLDLEMGFAGPGDVMEVVEDLAKTAWSSMGRSLRTLGNSNSNNTSFSRLSYDECIAKYGIDKPDLRSDIKIIRLDNATAKRNPKFPVIECLQIPEAFQNQIELVSKEFPRVEFIQFIDESQLKCEIAKHSNVPDRQWPNIYQTLRENAKLSHGNWIAISDRQEMCYENPTPLGKLRQRLVENEYIQPSLESIAVWVNKFPSFEPFESSIDEHGYPVYDYNRLKATHHPFTMVDLDDYHHLQNNQPLKCHGMHFDLVIDGVEVGGGSQRIHDSALQTHILKEVVGVKDPNQLFGHLLAALATGCPPHAGLAIGLDRMIAMLLGLSSIRDVIAFPKSMTGLDAVVGSPSRVTSEQLSQYHLRVN